jgi:hypothetical protein
MLNVFGSTDLLPLTGVTLPFLSVGCRTMMSCWALLAFIKASDTRQNAALSVRLPKKQKKNAPQTEPESWRTATGFFARPQEEPETAEEGSETVKFSSLIDQPEQEFPEPGTEPEQSAAPKTAGEEAPLPPLEVEEEGSDADNWREYFLRDEDWGEKP